VHAGMTGLRFHPLGERRLMNYLWLRMW
jgi:hypothetical protein